MRRSVFHSISSMEHSDFEIIPKLICKSNCKPKSVASAYCKVGLCIIHILNILVLLVLWQIYIDSFFDFRL